MAYLLDYKLFQFNSIIMAVTEFGAFNCSNLLTIKKKW